MDPSTNLISTCLNQGYANLFAIGTSHHASQCDTQHHISFIRYSIRHCNVCNLCVRLKGFGLKKYGNGGYDFPNVLQEVELKYVRNAVCDAAWSQYYSGLSIVPSMMCAADTGKGPCNGDIGGPLFDATTNVLVGIVSFGFCDASYPYPVVFSRIANQWHWIKTTICADHSNPKPDFCPPPKPTKHPKKKGKGGKGANPTKHPRRRKKGRVEKVERVEKQ